MLVLGPVIGWLRTVLGTGADGRLGIWTTPVEILLGAVCSFACVALIAVLVRRIPKVGKYIMG